MSEDHVEMPAGYEWDTFGGSLCETGSERLVATMQRLDGVETDVWLVRLHWGRGFCVADRFAEKATALARIRDHVRELEEEKGKR